jgi:hypothetical protein
LGKTQTASPALALLDEHAKIRLSDGRVCKVYPLRLWHVIQATSPTPGLTLAKLITLVTLIDDKPVTLEEAIKLTVRDVNWIASKIKT